MITEETIDNPSPNPLPFTVLAWADYDVFMKQPLTLFEFSQGTGHHILSKACVYNILERQSIEEISDHNNTCSHHTYQHGNQAGLQDFAQDDELG